MGDFYTLFLAAMRAPTFLLLVLCLAAAATVTAAAATAVDVTGDAVTTWDELKPRLSARRAKMPDFEEAEVAQVYVNSRRLEESDPQHGAGVRLPASVNNLKVKTNSSNPHKNEKNVALNLNIPASVSGFHLEEIDLKYVKKSRKKSANNKMSNLLIKYFTNRSSNLHLSSVTKEDEDRPEYFNYGDMKERRNDEYPGQDRTALNDDDIVFERPFLYKNKYPLKLLEKIRVHSDMRKKQREGKTMDADKDSNGTDALEDTRPRRASTELDEIIEEKDLKALESILVSKTPELHFDGLPSDAFQTSGVQIEDELSVSQLYNIFDSAVAHESEVDDMSDMKEDDANDLMENELFLKKKTEKKKYSDIDKSEKFSDKSQIGKAKNNDNWFNNNLANYFLTVIPDSFRSIFPGSSSLRRPKRSEYTDENDDNLEKEISNKKVYFNINKKHDSRFKDISRRDGPHLPPVHFSDPRIRVPGTKPVRGTPEVAKDAPQHQFEKLQHRPVHDDYAPQATSVPNNTPTPWLEDNHHPADNIPSGTNMLSVPNNPAFSESVIHKRLSKLDYYFGSLRLRDEACRRRVVCEVAEEPSVFSPLTEMIEHETSVAGDAKELGRVLLGTEEGARLLSYVEANRRGAQSAGRDCAVYSPGCSLSARDLLDITNLAMWREVSGWLTLKVLATSNSAVA